MNLLDVAYGLIGLLTLPFWGRKARSDWPGRFGKGESLSPPGERPRILLHAVSVGEVNALRSLVPKLLGQAEVVISVGTDTGIERARDLFSDRCAVVRYPLDFSWCVRRLLDRLRPSCVVLVELEVWPNFVAACRRRGIPIAVVNGRLSDRSFRGYRRIRWLLRRTFGSITVVGAQNAVYAGRFEALGAPRIEVIGSMKWDACSLEPDTDRAEAIAVGMGIDRGRPLIVAGSTAEDEEELLHRSCPPAAQLLCAPRKPEHFAEAAAALPACVRRCRPQDGNPASSRFLLDTIGELGAAYALADVVIVGRSFGSLHGSDPSEPAALGRPIVMGPRFEDFREIVDALAAAGGLIHATREDLAQVLRELVLDSVRRRAVGDRARECVLANRGASERAAALIARLLSPTRSE
ncbi:MAG: hypothetical protein H6811_07250 [Phycisphaeraceae bacterium]|nr:hypothetical protein [Phycisphaeraceae bacterium]